MSTAIRTGHQVVTQVGIPAEVYQRLVEAGHIVPGTATPAPEASSDDDTPETGTTTIASVARGSTRPLFCVRYTSNAGNTATYGVFWHGTKNGEERVGLRKMVNAGHRMCRPTRFSKGFFVALSKCTRI